MKTQLISACVLLAGLVAQVQARADVITEWELITLQAEHVEGTSPIGSSRIGAIVQAAVFDAVNGIERRYESFHVATNAPRGASPEAAAAAAAYTALLQLFPDQKSVFDAALATSLRHDCRGNDKSVARGVAWGQSVAEAILAWRSDDFATSFPPFLGGTAVGEWRPTPPDFTPGTGLPFTIMTPWVLHSQSQFRPPGPPSLTSDQYATDFNETKSKGGLTSALRTADETLGAQFWDSANGAYFWNSLAVRLSAERHLSLLQNARLFAVLNLAMADARIACWEAKYHFIFWRPVTAITLADTDGNPATTPEPTWSTLLGGTPPFPEYPSGHCTESGAAATVLAHYFGEHTVFYVDSDWMPGVTRSFSSFSAAVEDVKNARINGGIHFRTACDDGTTTGSNVASYAIENALLPVRGDADKNRSATR